MSERGYTVVEALVAIVVGAVLLSLLLIGPVALEYTVESWAAYFGKPTDVPFWHPLHIIAGVVLSEITIPVGLITWVVMLVVA